MPEGTDPVLPAHSEGPCHAEVIGQPLTAIGAEQGPEPLRERRPASSRRVTRVGSGVRLLRERDPRNSRADPTTLTVLELRGATVTNKLFGWNSSPNGGQTLIGMGVVNPPRT